MRKLTLSEIDRVNPYLFCDYGLPEVCCTSSQGHRETSPGGEYISRRPTILFPRLVIKNLGPFCTAPWRYDCAVSRESSVVSPRIWPLFVVINGLALFNLATPSAGKRAQLDVCCPSDGDGGWS